MEELEQLRLGNIVVQPADEHGGIARIGRSRGGEEPAFSGRFSTAGRQVFSVTQGDLVLLVLEVLGDILCVTRMLWQ